MRAGVEFVGDLSIERRAGGVLVKTPVISIVDDDESVREGTSERLHATSCLIADMRMPGMTGLELYNRLVQSGNRIPTILITAFPEDYARKRALRDGVICYLPKPFDARELLACIRLALGQPQAGDRQS
jgi:FixJ family two-component response regulator